MRFIEVWSDWRGSGNSRQIKLSASASTDVGGFTRTGGMTFHNCKNRYLTWYVNIASSCNNYIRSFVRWCTGNVFELTEVSMDENLFDNHVDIITNDHILSSSVKLCEIDDVVIVTFVTTAQIYWIQLAHPSTVVKVTIVATNLRNSTRSKVMLLWLLLILSEVVKLSICHQCHSIFNHIKSFTVEKKTWR